MSFTILIVSLLSKQTGLAGVTILVLCTIVQFLLNNLITTTIQ